MSDITVPPPPRHLFTLAGTPVQADVSAPLSLAGALSLCWLLVGQRYPQRGFVTRLALTVIWAGLLLVVFCLHSLGHVVSARAVRAPVDTLLINAVHWITLYYDNTVAPEAHLGRAAGGPLANLLGIVLSGWLRRKMPPGPFRRDLVNVFAVFNAAIGGAAMLPTRSFDGGTLLRWSVYRRTGDSRAAARAVRQAGLGVALALSGFAMFLLLARRYLTGTILAAFGLVSALESLRRD